MPSGRSGPGAGAERAGDLAPEPRDRLPGRQPLSPTDRGGPPGGRYRADHPCRSPAADPSCSARPIRSLGNQNYSLLIRWNVGRYSVLDFDVGATFSLSIAAVLSRLLPAVVGLEFGLSIARDLRGGRSQEQNNQKIEESSSILHGQPPVLCRWDSRSVPTADLMETPGPGAAALFCTYGRGARLPRRTWRSL